ncbi:MAG: hypothetical protein K2Y21_09125 [Phycisphaerales bacterium]|nr:hypothetical protein [Phycisphaerales bacterium]
MNATTRNFMERIRLKAMAVVLAVIVAAVGVIAWSTIPAWPVIGVGVAVVAVALNSIGSRLEKAVCYGCGGSMAGQPIGERGSICPTCGTINQPLLAKGEIEDERA